MVKNRYRNNRKIKTLFPYNLVNLSVLLHCGLYNVKIEMPS